MPSREALIREILLTDDLTIEPPMDRETRKVITAIIDGKDERLEFSAGEMSLTATAAESAMTADQWRTLIAAARHVLLELERAGKPIPETSLAQRGFTAEQVAAGIKFLRAEKVVARREGGTVTDLTGAGGRGKRTLSPASLAPRTSTAAPAPSSSTTSTAPRMTADPRMVGDIAGDPTAMGKKLAAQAEQMPNPGFEVPAANTAPVKKTEQKTVPVAVPEGAVVTYKTAVLDAFARTGKPTVAWSELGVTRPALGDLPEDWTPEKVLGTAIDGMCGTGELVVNDDFTVCTYVPAEKAVKAVVEWLGRAALPWKLLTVAHVVARKDVLEVVPSGWAAEVIATLALDAVTDDGVLERVEGGYMKPVPKPAPEPEQKQPAPEEQPEPETPKTAGDTTSPAADTKPEGTRPVAPASGQETETPAESETPETPAPVTKAVAKTTAPATVAPAPVQVVPDTTPWLASIDGNIRHLTQILTLPQASAREALSEGALLQSTLRRVMVLLERHGVLTSGELQRAFNGKLPDKREALDIALKYGVQVGALAATGAKNPKGWGARYTLADPTRVGIARHELLNEAMKARTRRPVVGAGK